MARRVTTDCPPALARRFRIEKRLGEGGMGAVFLGTQPELDRPVAVKILRLNTKDPLRVERFEKEARALAAVEHPNLVRLLDFGEESEEGSCFLVMEYVQGLPLSRSLRRRQRMPAKDAQTILFCVGEAIQAIHDAGMLHRDVKPDNIMIDTNGRPVLMDLGLARLADEAEEDELANRAVGTPAYMAPEVWTKEGADPRCDWYSWGATLFECLDGDPPFTRGEIEASLRKDGRWPIPPRPDTPDGGDSLAALASWCLRPRPETRPEDFSAIQRVLEGGEAPPAACWSSTRPRTEDERPAALRRKRKQQGPRMAAAAAAVALALGSFLYGWISGPEAPTLPEPLARVRLEVRAAGELVAVRRDDQGPGTVLEVLTDPEGQPLLAPLGDRPGDSAPFQATGPFQLRLRIGDEVGPFSRLPAPPAQVPLVLDHAWVPGGVVLMGIGAAPEGYALTSVARPAMPLSLLAHSETSWRARASLPGEFQGTQPALGRELGGGLVARLALPWPRLPAAGQASRDLYAFLERHRSFVTEGGREPSVDAARETWLRLRSFALACWEELGRQQRDDLLRLIGRLAAQEEGRPRWSRAASFLRDLGEASPRAARLARRDLRTLAEVEVPQPPAEVVDAGVRALVSLSRGLRDGPDAYHGLTRPDRSAPARARRGAFLPSPHARPQAETALAWGLWSHWTRWAMTHGGWRARSVTTRVFDTIGSPDEDPLPWLPPGVTPQTPSAHQVATERAQAWTALTAALPVRRQRLATAFVLGYLPPDGREPERELLDDLLARVAAVAGPEVRLRRGPRVTGWRECLAALAPHAARARSLPSEASEAFDAVLEAYEAKVGQAP